MKELLLSRDPNLGLPLHIIYHTCQVCTSYFFFNRSLIYSGVFDIRCQVLGPRNNDRKAARGVSRSFHEELATAKVSSSPRLPRAVYAVVATCFRPFSHLNPQHCTRYISRINTTTTGAMGDGFLRVISYVAHRTEAAAGARCQGTGNPNCIPGLQIAPFSIGTSKYMLFLFLLVVHLYFAASGQSCGLRCRPFSPVRAFRLYEIINSVPYTTVYTVSHPDFPCSIISTAVGTVSVPKRSALKAPRRELSEDVSFRTGTPFVVEQSGLEKRPSGGVIYFSLWPFGGKTGWDQRVACRPCGRLYIPRFSLEGSGPGGIRWGWDQDAKRE